MELATTLLKKQIRLLRPITNSCPVGITRAAQDKIAPMTKTSPKKKWISVISRACL